MLLRIAIPVFVLCISAASGNDELTRYSTAICEDSAKTKVSVNREGICNPKFITELKASGCAGSVDITDSMLILEKTDTAFFPRLLATENERFTGETPNQGIQLIVKRTSYTSLAFNLSFVERNKQTTFRGEAHLRPCFFMASEIDETPEGDSYAADEYVYTSADGKEQISFRVGESNGAAIKVIVLSPQISLGLDGSPVLRIAR
ncbi:MAG: hypothetical protein ACRC3B_16695 [Bacteroidia bacterium]